MGANVVLVWIGVGGAVGLLASMLLSQVPAGVVGSVIIGMIGGVLAGLALGLLNLPIAPGLLTNAGVAFVGSVVLIALAQQLL